VPSTAAIVKARRRLGVDPMRELLAVVCRPVAVSGTAGAFYRRWRLSAQDDSTVDLSDTAANERGRPARSGRGDQQVGCPQIRLVGLVECGTHAPRAGPVLDLDREGVRAGVTGRVGVVRSRW
jgi:hypothetical protein